MLDLARNKQGQLWLAGPYFEMFHVSHKRTFKVRVYKKDGTLDKKHRKTFVYKRPECDNEDDYHYLLIKNRNQAELEAMQYIRSVLDAT